MEAVAAIILGIVVFMHAWQLFEVSEPRVTGVVGAVGAILLVALLGWQPVPLLTKVAPAAFSASVVIWAIYAALVAAVGLWGFDARGLGLYSAYGAVVMVGQIIYCGITEYALVGIICGAIQAIAFAMLFFYLALRRDGLKRATAWVLVLVGPIHGILAALTLMGYLT